MLNFIKRHSQEVATICVVILSWILVYAFASAYYIQSPIVITFRPMIVKREAKPTPKIKPKATQRIVKQVLADEPTTSSMTHEEIVKSSPHGAILYKIWNHESGRGLNKDPKGRHNYCKSIGKSNEFGLMIKNKCFDTFEESVAYAEKTLVKLGVDDNLVNALCSYNLGSLRVDGKIIPHQNCKYYQDYLTM